MVNINISSNNIYSARISLIKLMYPFFWFALTRLLLVTNVQKILCIYIHINSGQVSHTYG